MPSPAGQTPTAGPLGRADTPTATAAANKKGAAAQPQPMVRTLTPAEEARYGVQHHERLSGGVQFRSDRAQKLTQAKSNVQTLKLAGALAELEIPVRLFMPTERVCKEFEKLIQSVNLLLDARKVAEKVESEIRVLEAAKAERERKSREAGGEGSKNPENPEVKKEAEEGGNTALESTAADNAGPAVSGEAAASGTGAEGGDARGEKAAPATGTDGNHKRSASVLSGASDKSNKRQRR